VKRILSLLLIVIFAWNAGGEYLFAKDVEEPIAKSKFDQKRIEYISLQPLIDATEPGGTLKLEEGPYEGPAIITKPISIVGVSQKTEIHTMTDDPAFMIESSDVTLEGLKIIDKLKEKLTPSLLATGSRLTLQELELQTSSTAISLKGVTDSVLQNNEMRWNAGDRVKLTARGNGIEIYNSSGILLDHNAVQGLYDGIYSENNTDLIMTNNTVEHSRYAYHLMYSENITVKDNRSHYNITGIMVMTTEKVLLSGNLLAKQSENVNSQGILLFDARNVLIEKNIVSDNRVGFYIENAADNKIINNVIEKNFVGLQLISTTQLEVSKNNFIGNVTNVLNDELSQQHVVNNYWDSFQGIDRDGDHWSDLTYSASPFFQQLMLKRPPFQLFFGTAGIQFLEELYQGDRLIWLTDERPSMKPFVLDYEQEHTSFQYGMLIFWSTMLLIALTIIYLTRRRVE